LASSGCDRRDGLLGHPRRREGAAGQLRREGAVLTVVRIAIWDLGESLASLEELREKLPWLPEGQHWISNEAADRFGLVAFGDPPEEALRHARELIGADPVVGEEFDVE
jgi:hypothetical protein